MPNRLASPALTRSRKQKKKGNGKIFDFENDPVARQLRDKAMSEHAKYLKRKAAKEVDAVNERRKAMEERRRVLDEKNRLAAENEQIRKETERKEKERSEQAIANLVATRKRRR